MILINTSQKKNGKTQMPNKYKKKKYFTVLAIREMPIRITSEAHFTTVKIKIIQEKQK